MDIHAGQPDATSSRPTRPRGGRHRVRQVFAVVLAIVAALTTTVALTGAWVRRTTIDTNHWVSTVGPVAADPKVEAALSTWATDELSHVVDTKKMFATTLPRRAQILAGPLSTAVESFVGLVVNRFFTSDAFQALWVNANRVAHERVMQVLEGKSKVLDIENGRVVLNLVPVLDRVLQTIDQRTNGLLSSHVPALNGNFTADQARAALSSALGRPIPSDFGTIPVFDKKQLSSIQRAVQLFQRAVVLMLIVAALLIAAAVLVAPDRRKIAIWLGLGTALVVVVFRAIARATAQNVISHVVKPQNRSAVADVLHQVFASYRAMTAAVIALGIIVAVVAFLAGPSHTALTVRETVTRSAWLSEHGTVVQLGTLAVGLAIVLLINLTFGALLVVALVIGSIELVLYRLRVSAAPSTHTTI